MSGESDTLFVNAQAQAAAMFAHHQPPNAFNSVPTAGTSLLEQAALLRKQHDALSSNEQVSLQRRQDEDRILKEASHVQTNALQAASELAEGVV